MTDSSDRDDRPRNSGAPRGREGAGGRSASDRGSDGRTPGASGGPQRGSAPQRGGSGAPKRDGAAPWKRGGAPKRDGAAPQRDGAPWKKDGPAPKRDGAPWKKDGPAPKRDGAPAWKRDGAAPRDGATPRRDGPPAWRKDGPPSVARRDGAPASGAGFARREGGAGAPRGPRPGDRDGRVGADEVIRPRRDVPVLSEDVTAKDLDKVARGELRTLSKDNSDGVARHLVMAARLIDIDPELAHKHALEAARRAGRVGVVRETLAITAYATGDFALALRELRTYRRITGKNDQLPLMVDSERGVGRPDRALELGRSVPRAELDTAVQVELAIAMSGARLDLHQPEAALVELQIPQLDPERAFAWSPALFDAYATVLEELGREDEAELWWQRSDRATEALERAEIGEDTIEIIEEEAGPDAAEIDD